MKNLFREYSQIIGYTVTGLVFSLSVFLLFLNFYHYNYISEVYNITDTDKGIYASLNEKVNLTKNNINFFDINSYSGSLDKTSLNSIKNRLSICVDKLQTDDITSIVNKNELSILDVYNYQQLYQSDIVNECLVKQLYDLSTDVNINKNISQLSTISPFMEDTINSLIGNTDYVQSTIKNNSSYSFSSNTSLVNIFSPTRDSFYEIRDSYVKSVDLIYDTSLWYKGLVG